MAQPLPSSRRFPIATLIQTRMADLGLRRGQLVARLGYQNASKALRLLDAVIAGQIAGKDHFLARLPAALAVPPEVVREALAATAQILDEERAAEERREEAEWRARFVPHAIIMTTQRVPSPIFAAAFIGVGRLRGLELDSSRGEATYVEQALQALHLKYPTLKVPTFGFANGVIVNHTPDRAVHYDLTGAVVAELGAAYRLGVATLTVR